MYTPLKKINSFGFIDKNQDTISTASFIYTNQQHQDLFKYNNFDKQIYCEQSQNENDWLANQKQEVSEFGSQKQYINEKIEIRQFNEIKKTQTSQNKVAESMIKQTQQNDYYQKHQQSKSEISIKKQIQIDKCQNSPISSNKNQIRKRKKIFNKQTSKASNKLLVQTMQIKNEVNSIKKDVINNNLSINNHIKQNSLNLQKTDENNCFKLYKQLIKHQSNIMQWFQYLSNLSLDNVCKQQEVIKKILKIYIQLKNSLQNYKYLDYKQSLSILLNKCKLIQNSISLINFIKSNYEILQNKLKEFREFIKNFLVLNPLQKLIKYQSIALILSQLECIKIKYERKLQKQNLIAYTRYSQDFTSFLKTQTAQITELIILFNKQQLKQRFQQKKEVYLQQIKEKLLSNNLLQFEKFKILEYLNKINHQ